MWFSDYVFLERSWARDEITLKVLLNSSVHLVWAVSVSYIYILKHFSVQLGLQRLKDFPTPFWLALFVEGTRFTTAKLQAAQEYAAKNGLPIPKNVLVPRTKVSQFLCRNSSIYVLIRLSYQCFMGTLRNSR